MILCSSSLSSDRKPFLALLDKEFFSILDESYLGALEPFRELFGTGVHDAKLYGQYQAAYLAYVTSLTQRLTAWISDRMHVLLAEGEMECSLVDDLMKGFMNRVQWLTFGVWRTSRYWIGFATQDPIICTSWLRDLDSIIKFEEKWINLVGRVIFVVRITNLVCYSHLFIFDPFDGLVNK